MRRKNRKRARALARARQLHLQLNNKTMLARFFANRPVFAWVNTIVIMLEGVASIMVLPVAQYPAVAPPSVNISDSYVGASAETVENSVTQVLEQQLTGIEGLQNITS